MSLCPSFQPHLRPLPTPDPFHQSLQSCYSLRALCYLSPPCPFLCCPCSWKCSGRHPFVSVTWLCKLAQVELVASTSVLHNLALLCSTYPRCKFWEGRQPQCLVQNSHPHKPQTSGKRTWGRGVNCNEDHTGLGYGLSENSKQDDEQGHSLAAGLLNIGLWEFHEDDLSFYFSCRLVFRGMSVSRPNTIVGKCRMIRHSRDKKNEPNPQRCVVFIYIPSLFWLGRLQE